MNRGVDQTIEGWEAAWQLLSWTFEDEDNRTILPDVIDAMYCLFGVKK